MAIKYLKKTNPQDELIEYRRSIDEIDIQLSTLLNERAKLVFSVGEYKRKHQLPIYDPEREKQIRQKIRSRSKNTDVLNSTELEKFFMGIIENCRSIEAVHVRRTEARLLMENSLFEFKEKKSILIVGFGLLGSSLYLAMNDFFNHWDFYVEDPNVSEMSLENWKKENLYKNLNLKKESSLQSFDIIILAAPITENQKYVTNLDVEKETIVFDLGSTKAEIHHSFKKGDGRFIFIGGHPLAGKESTGFENGDPTLFFNKTFCWTLDDIEHCDEKFKNTFNVISMSLGANSVWVSPEKHDQILAWSSHLPQLVSTSFALSLEEENLTSYADLFPSFSSEIMRISGSSFKMWESIILTNKKNIAHSLDIFILKLQKMKDDLGNVNSIEESFKIANSVYKKFKQQKKPGV